MASDKEKLKQKYLQYQSIMESDFAKELRKADEGLSAPNSPTDILDYLGNIEPLHFTEEDKDAVRILLKKTIKEKGAEYIWQNRVFLRFELSYINETFGL